MENRKTQYTKSVIRESFLFLLREKPVEKITVTELCAKADINRSTFYAHYLDVYDLKEQLEQGFFQEIGSLFQVKQWDNFMLEIMRVLQKNADFCQSLFGKYGNHEFIYHCVSSWLDMSGTYKSPDDHWRMLFITSGAAAVTGNWIQGGMKESPEEIAHILNCLCDNAGKTTF